MPEPQEQTRAAGPPRKTRAKLGTDARSVTRLTVNIGPSTAKALQHLVDNDNVTVTEALRRLVSLGFLVHQKVVDEKRELLLRKGDETQQVLIPQ